MGIQYELCFLSKLDQLRQDSDNDFVKIKCQGGCSDGSEPTGTDNFSIERVTLGWPNLQTYNQFATNNDAALIMSRNNIAANIQTANPTWTTAEVVDELNLELGKVYPYDLVAITSNGFFNKFPDHQSLQFEVSHNQYFGNPIKCVFLPFRRPLKATP